MTDADDDEGTALRLAARMGEALRRGGWWAGGAAAGALVAQLAADLTSVGARGVWEPSLAGHAIGLASAATLGLAVGSPTVRDPRDVSPVGLAAASLAAPWVAVVAETVVGHVLVAGTSSVRGLEAAVALLRDPNELSISRFFLLCAYAWALAVGRWAYAGGDLTGPWLGRRSTGGGVIGSAVVTGAVLPWVAAASMEFGAARAADRADLPAIVLVAVGAGTVPAGALLAERRLRPWLARLLRCGDDGPPPVSSGT